MKTFIAIFIKINLLTCDGTASREEPNALAEDTPLNVSDTRDYQSVPVSQPIIDDTFKTIEPFLTNAESHESLGITDRNTESLPNGFREFKGSLFFRMHHVDHLYDTLHADKTFLFSWWDNKKIKERLQRMPCYFPELREIYTSMNDLFSPGALNRMNQQKEFRIIRGYDRQRDRFYFFARVTDFEPKKHPNEQEYEYFVFVFNYNGEFQELLSSGGRCFRLTINESMDADKAINLLRHLLLDDTDGDKVLYPCPLGYETLEEMRIKWKFILIALAGILMPFLLGLPWTKHGAANFGIIVLLLVISAFASCIGEYYCGVECGRFFAWVCGGSILWMVIA